MWLGKGLSADFAARETLGATAMGKRGQSATPRTDRESGDRVAGGMGCIYIFYLKLFYLFVAC